MTDQLLKKINFEYEKFYLSMIATSKANLFALSKEIEQKKQVAAYLKENVEKYSEEVKQRLQCCDNLLEETSRYVADHDKKALPDAVGEFLQQYV